MTVEYRIDATHLHVRASRAGTGGWLAVGFPQAPFLMLGATAIVGSFSSTVPVQMYFLGGKSSTLVHPLAAAKQVLEDTALQVETNSHLTMYFSLPLTAGCGEGGARSQESCMVDQLSDETHLIFAYTPTGDWLGLYHTPHGSNRVGMSISLFY